MEGSAQDLLARLLAGELDCVLGRLPPDVAKLGRDIASLTFVNLYEDDVCVVCGPDHPAARLKKPGYARLAQCDWVLQRISSSVRQALTEAFLRQGLLLPYPWWKPHLHPGAGHRRRHPPADRGARHRHMARAAAA